jgi:4-oxalocrotonate tautomerase family enzyme
MVVVQVEWLAGRTPEQKEQLVAGITDILGRIGGAQRQNVHVVLHDGVPVKVAQTGKGCTRLGEEEVSPIIAPGVLLDVPVSKGAEDLEQGYAVTGADLEECCERQNVTVEPGSVALIRTGNARGLMGRPRGLPCRPWHGGERILLARRERGSGIGDG